MGRLQPTGAQRVGRGQARHIRPAGIDAGDGAFGIGRQGDLRVQVRGGTIMIFAFLQGRLAGTGRIEQAQTRDSSREEVGVAAQEAGVDVGERARVAAVNLEEPVRVLSIGPDDENVDEGFDAVLGQEVGIGEPRLASDVGRRHRSAGLQSVAFA